MAFWGVEVKPGKPYCHNTQTRRLHISQATLGGGSSSATTKSLVQCNVGDKAPVFICCLMPEKLECIPMSHEFEEGDDDVIFSVLGPRSVHLTGFYLDKPLANVNNDSDTESYGEDIAETESDFENDDEDEYEDDFIDDGDVEVVPESPRPKSKVVIKEIEEISDDDKPAKGNGKRRRLQKKYQVSDSDGDAQKEIAKNDRRIFTVESDDEDGLPLSSVIETKHLKDSSGNDQKQNIDKGGPSSIDLGKENEECMPLSSVLNAKDVSIQEQPDEREFLGDEKNEAQDGGDQVTDTAKKTDDIIGCDIERSVEQPTSAPLLSLEVEPRTDEPSKKKKRKLTEDGQTDGIRDDCMVDVHEIDKAELLEAKIEDNPEAIEAVNILATDRGSVSARNDSVEKPKKKKKKRAIEGQYGGVENDSRIHVQQKDNVIVEAKIGDTLKNDLVKEQPIEKEVVQSSYVNDVKIKKKEKKKAKERQSTDAGDDRNIDVQVENIQVKDDMNVDFKQEALVKDNDNGAGPVGHESGKLKKKKKREKESQNVGVQNDNIDKDNAIGNIDNSKKHGKERQACEVGEAGIADINQEDAVKDKVHENLSNDKGDVQWKENDAKIKKKKKKQAKEKQTSEAGSRSMIDAQIDGIIAVEEARIKEMCFEQDSSLVPLKIDHDTKEKTKKKKKKRALEGQTGRVGEDSFSVVHKEVRSEIVEAKTDAITMEDPMDCKN